MSLPLLHEEAEAFRRKYDHVPCPACKEKSRPGTMHCTVGQPYWEYHRAGKLTGIITTAECDFCKFELRSRFTTIELSEEI